ncbi:CPBP family intramembrane glutamic endopeptidase [Bifidobacterium aquikefiri]|uniref:CPBP family intramembrane glutamic endopeptidase n=1 Tax=Bifidobacterium aquikefiri TaxID=1653207 RepID=UPI0039EA6944
MPFSLIIRVFRPSSVIRHSDLLSDDHPRFDNPGKVPVRLRPFMRLLAFFGILIAITVGTALGLSAICSALDIVVSTEHRMLIGFTAQLFGAVIAYALVAALMERRWIPSELDPRRVADLFKGMAVAALCIGLTMAILAACGFYRIMAFDAAYNPLLDMLTLGLGAGIAEELIMRGMVLRLLEEWLGSWYALGISALLFGLAHWVNQDGSLWGGIAIAIEAGLLFGAIYMITRSLWWCIGLHMAWNVLEGPVFGSIVSGSGEQRSWFIPQWSGPEIFTGGSFGIEASIIPVVLLGTLSMLILLAIKRQGMVILPSWQRKKRLQLPPGQLATEYVSTEPSNVEVGRE